MTIAWSFSRHENEINHTQKLLVLLLKFKYLLKPCGTNTKVTAQQITGALPT